MSRPKPEVLLTHTHRQTYKTEQILAAEAIYAVFLNGKPINIRSFSSLVNYPGPKYKKFAFANSASAFNLAEKLNALFSTTTFQVVKLTCGEVISDILDGIK
jgi:hypothetical protein